MLKGDELVNLGGKALVVGVPRRRWKRDGLEIDKDN